MHGQSFPKNLVVIKWMMHGNSILSMGPWIIFGWITMNCTLVLCNYSFCSLRYKDNREALKNIEDHSGFFYCLMVLIRVDRKFVPLSFNGFFYFKQICLRDKPIKNCVKSCQESIMVLIFCFLLILLCCKLRVIQKLRWKDSV